MPPLFASELETPAAIVDLDRMARNLDTMAAYCALHGLALRPHVKTHKAPRVAAEQMRLGAVGLTCATPRELEVMSEVANDLLLAHPPVGMKVHRVLSIPREVRLSVALDDMAVAEPLAAVARDAARVVGVLAEVDLGMHRVGVQGPADVVELAAAISELDGVTYDGIIFYPGHIRERVERQGAQLRQLEAELGLVLEALHAADLVPRVVSGGSTPIGLRIHEVGGVTEVRPGTYAYNDRTTAVLGACDWEDCALTVLATVISTSVPGQAVIDAGSKALGREPLPTMEGGGGVAGYGALLDRPEVVVSRMSEEHGILDLGRTDWQPEVGDQVRVVPNHVCYVVNLFDTIYGMRDDVVETHWPVTARGRDGDRPVWPR